MINFKISAPGRIFLSGEHLVTYGKRFVIAGLNLRTRLEFCELPMSDGIIKIDFARVRLQREISFHIVQQQFSNINVSEIRSNPVNFLKFMKHIIDVYDMWETLEQRFSLQIFFYLLSTTINLQRRPFRLRVSTEIPSGPGLGSSTSFAVCLAACFLHWKRLQSGHHTKFNDEELEKIRRHAKLCEEIMQDEAFASLDAKICVLGRIKRCVRDDYKNYTTQTIHSRTDLRLLLINTNIRQNKDEQIEQMADLGNSHSDFHSILNRFEEIAKSMYAKICHINSIADNNDPDIRDKAYSGLEEDIVKYQILLRNYLSHEEYDRICSIGFDYGLAGKLTGFGGGYVYFLIPPRLTSKEIRHIEAYCLEQHIDYKFASVDYDGVTIDE